MPFERIAAGSILSRFSESDTSPHQLRWDPLSLPEQPTDLLQGLVTMAGNGDALAHVGAAVHLYAINRSMKRRSFYNADGEMLFVPQFGRHRFTIELGIIEAHPGEIVVIPRGVRFRLELLDGAARGYACENYGAYFRMPVLGRTNVRGASAEDTSHAHVITDTPPAPSAEILMRMLAANRIQYAAINSISYFYFLKQPSLKKVMGNKPFTHTQTTVQCGFPKNGNVPMAQLLAATEALRRSGKVDAILESYR